MKYKNILILVFLFSNFSCDKFTEINENPNEPTDVPTEVLLPSAIRQSVNTMVMESFLLGNNAAQLTAKVLRTEVDAYNWNAFPTVWQGLYRSLTDVKAVEKKAILQDNKALEGVAIVLRSWIFSTLTNAYGDIPYSEAIAGASTEANFTPIYDTQETIYIDLLAELERASTLLAGEGSIDGDILLGGNSAKWLKFCNSLRLRLLMTANNQITDAGEQFAEIVNTENIISSNEENVTLSYLNSFPNQYPTISIKTGDFDAVALSQTALNVMTTYNDPRQARYARPDNDNYINPVFTGAENGEGSCNKTGSRLGAQYFNDPTQTLAVELGLDLPEGIVISYAEVAFLLAEAAAKNWISNDVEVEYRAGIEASMNYYRVAYEPFGYADFNDFYTNSGVAYNAPTDIWKQKWLALFFTGLEPYFEIRRWYFESGNSFDGIPFIDAACNNSNDDKLPLRFLYPSEEQSLNEANYLDAISRLDGGNSFNASMWLVK